MNVSNGDRAPMVRNSYHATTWGVIVAVVAVSIVVVLAILAYDNSKGTDTSGDDTRAVVNNGPPAADINTTIPPLQPFRPLRHPLLRRRSRSPRGSLAAATPSYRGVRFTPKVAATLADGVSVKGHKRT
jgi:hypothetical protein